jgi:hypothetical protein
MPEVGQREALNTESYGVLQSLLGQSKTGDRQHLLCPFDYV